MSIAFFQFFDTKESSFWNLLISAESHLSVILRDLKSAVMICTVESPFLKRSIFRTSR